MSEVCVELLKEGSFLGIVLILFGAIGWAARVMYKRLYGADGIVTADYKRRGLFMDRLEQAYESQVEILRDNGAHLMRLIEIHADINSGFSTVRTNQALWHLATAAIAAAESEMNDPERLRDVRTHIIKAQQALSCLNNGRGCQNDRESS